MCGVAGSIGPNYPDPERVARALATMNRRGPDAQGTHFAETGGMRCALLHTRLSIIDLDPRSHQPFVQDDLALVFNGEIYNHIEVRRELEGLGHVFATASDTEVLLQAWRRWGPAALDRLEGMWAFALIDRRAGRVVLSRDRFGEKPLYLRRVGPTLYFASEIKTLAALSGGWPEPDGDQLRRYLVNGYKSLYKKPRTWHRDVTELPAASWAAVEDGVLRTPTAYWSLHHAPQPMTAEQALEGVKERLDEAVRLRLRADVPVAFCLSGGVDSTTLAGIAVKRLGRPVHAFSIIDSDERYHELDNIDATVAFLGCDSHKIATTTRSFLDELDDLIGYHDAPVVTISYFLHAKLQEAVSAAGYKVSISGNGADELFTGYYDHYAFWLAEMSGRADFPRLLDDWRGGYGAFVQNPVLRDPLGFVRDPGLRDHVYLNADLFRGWLTEPFVEPFAEEPLAGSLLRNRMLNELRFETMPVILKEDDLNAMRCSVENRSPYLDRRLAEFLFSVPAEHLVRDGYAKWLLRAAGEGAVADSVRLDKRKRGFNASIDSLIDRRDPQTRERLTADSPIFDYVRRDALLAFLDGDMTDNSFSKFMFSFVSAKLFLERQKEASA